MADRPMPPAGALDRGSDFELGSPSGIPPVRIDGHDVLVEGVDVELRAIRRQLLPGHDKVGVFGYVGDMIADAFEILGAKQKMRAGGDVEAAIVRIAGSVVQPPFCSCAAIRPWITEKPSIPGI